MKFKKTSFTGTKEILKYADHESISVMVESDGIVANADGKKIVAAGTIVGGKTQAVLTNRQEPVQKKNTQGTYDSATLAPAGVNNDIVFTAKTAGASGISVEILNPGAANQALKVTTVNNKISVSLATDAGSAITSTAAQVIAAVNNDPDASERVSVANAAANDGTGVMAAVALTPLAGGAVSTGTAAEGVLLYDVNVTNGDHPGAMVIRGTVNQNQIPEAPCADALAALKGRIVFMK
ncbi:hypothetical protein FDZ73_19665 [bacterium]|nr:MAG: hypothetical protein FDZ73_19665 [bacterium]